MTIKRPFRTVMASSLALAAFSFPSALQSQTAHSMAADHAAVSASQDARSSFATSLERQMRARGTDVRVQLDGEGLDTLRVEWPTIHRSDIYRFVTSPAAQQAHRMGFSTVLFTNGSQRWEYNLTRESMISSPENL